jgi:DNA-binding HxlR family transcriptional regulator
MNAPRSGCPINLTLEALGDRWCLIVIRDLMFGNRRHFRELLTPSCRLSATLFDFKR